MDSFSRIAITILTLAAGCVACCLIGNAEKQYEIKSKGEDYYYQRRHLAYVDDEGRFHEPIGMGCYAIWPSKESYLEAQKRK